MWKLIGGLLALPVLLVLSVLMIFLGSEDYTRIIRLNWELDLPASEDCLYETDSGASFGGDGERYHVLEYSSDSQLQETLEQEATPISPAEEAVTAILDGLSVPAVLAEHSAWVVRYALGSVQYRSMLEWSDQTLAEAQSAYDRVANFIERAGAAVGEQPSREEIMAISADALPADFVAAMNDDINVSGASAAIFTAIRSGNTLLSKLADRADSDVAKAEVREALVNVRAMLDTLGLDPLAEPWVSDGAAGGAAGAGADSAEHDALDKLVSEQLAERAEARKAKDFARADAIRDALGAAGIAIEDGPQGSTWSLK